MSEELKKHITDELKKFRHFQIKGRRVRLLFSATDKIDEEPSFNFNDSNNINAEERIRMDASKRKCDEIREEGNISWLTTGEYTISY